MTQNYFVYNGHRYNTGDSLRVCWYNPPYTQNCKIKEAIFVNCDPERDQYNFIVDGRSFCYTQKLFYRIICKTTPKSSVQGEIQIQKRTFSDELNIDGMLIAWIWYIFIMAIAVIFNDCIMMWIIASIVFFNYRNKKLNKGGYKK
jgi:hypothetical protein